MKLGKVNILALAMIIAVSIGILTQSSNRVRALGEVYYVSTTGNDTNPGTLAQPWKTIQHAADTLVAGNTVYIRAGTYNERVVPANSGSAGNVITYAAYPGEVVTIDGTGVDVPEYTGLFTLEERHYIRFRVCGSSIPPIMASSPILQVISPSIITTHTTPGHPASAPGAVTMSSWITTR